MSRYHYYNGGNPEIRAQMFMVGPQDEKDVPDDVVAMLARLPKCSKIAILYNRGVGERVDIYSKIEEDSPAPAAENSGV